MRITDRGPFVSGRIIDVSQIAARELGFAGLAQVCLKILSLPENRQSRKIDCSETWVWSDHEAWSEYPNNAIIAAAIIRSAAIIIRAAAVIARPVAVVAESL